MKRLLQLLIGIVLAAVVLPPLWFALFPADPPPALPAAGKPVGLAGGASVNVLEQGSGPPVVMVHGLPGSAYDWRETTVELARLGRRAMPYDRVGYGRSDPRMNGAYTAESNASELLQLLEALDLRDVTVVGWSYGGVTAMTAAMSQPERVGRIVLVGTGGPDSADAAPPSPSSMMRFFYSDPVLRWRATIPPLGVGLMKAGSAAAFSDQPQPDWWLDGLRGNFARWETLIAFREEMFGMKPESTAGFDPSRIAVPTLLLHGDDDRLAPVGIGRYLAEVIPGARLIEYPGGSHALPVTHAQQIAREIAAFSAEH